MPRRLNVRVAVALPGCSSLEYVQLDPYECTVWWTSTAFHFTAPPRAIVTVAGRQRIAFPRTILAAEAALAVAASTIAAPRDLIEAIHLAAGSEVRREVLGAHVHEYLLIRNKRAEWTPSRPTSRRTSWSGICRSCRQVTRGHPTLDTSFGVGLLTVATTTMDSMHARMHPRSDPGGTF